MIDEIIESKRKELLDELKRYEELQEELEGLKKEQQKLVVQWKKLDEQHSALGGKSLILMQRRANSFNIFQRLFSKKYKEHIRNMEKVKRIQEEKNINNTEYCKIDEMISEKEKQIKEIEDKELRKKYLILQDRKKTIKMIISENPQITENVEFMLEAVKTDLHFIEYDTSNNTELYLYVLETMKKVDGFPEMELSEENRELNNRRIKRLSEIQQEILNPRIVEEGKYKLPTKYIFEEIRKTFQKFPQDIPTQLEHDPLKIDGVLPKEYGEELQKMWEDEENYFAVHGVGRNYTRIPGEKDINESYEEMVNSIFRNGIRATCAMGETVPEIEATMYIKHPNNGFSFVDALDYSYAGTYGFIICQIPKAGYGKQPTQAVWGIDAKGEYNAAVDKAYLLPRYIKGFVRNNAYVPKSEYRIRGNDIEAKKYKHFIIDKKSEIHDSEHPFEKEI